MLDKMVMKYMAIYNKEKAIVQNTYQMYRHDSCQRLRDHHKMALEGKFKFGLKIVRGAYMEIERRKERKKRITHPLSSPKTKGATDRDFNNMTKYLIENVDTIDFMVATHNEGSWPYLPN